MTKPYVAIAAKWRRDGPTYGLVGGTAEQLAALLRNHWEIEKRLHNVREALSS